MEEWHVLTPKLAVRLAAPHTWPASVYPALFGEVYCVLTGHTVSITVAISLLLACILMQSAVNTLNDYFDFVKGADSAEDCVEVSDAVLVYEHLNPVHALLLGLAYLGTAAVLAFPIIMMAGPAPLFVGAIGGIAVLLYSGGPYPLSYLPVGEVVSGVVMGGLIPLGIMAAVTGQFHWDVMAAALPFILGIALIMMTNNTCDIEKDRDAKRYTLPVLLDRERARMLYRDISILWLILLCVLPCLYVGLWGLICPVLLFIIARHAFGFLMASPLMQAQRVVQMKGILKANLLGNGAYLLTLAVYILLGGTAHG